MTWGAALALASVLILAIVIGFEAGDRHGVCRCNNRSPTTGTRAVNNPCNALKGLEMWQPTCDLEAGHGGPHRWHGKSDSERIREIEDTQQQEAAAQ